MQTNDPRWKTASMSDDEMHFLAKVLKDGAKDPVIARLHKQWSELWVAWDKVGRFQAGLERAGVGGTEADNLFKRDLAPKIEAFQKDFTAIMGHLSKIANS